MLISNQFKKRLIRTERSALIQITCVECGFTTVGVRERIQRIENEHPNRCKSSSPCLLARTREERPHSDGIECVLPVRRIFSKVDEIYMWFVGLANFR
jgi:hypothetical protein